MGASGADGGIRDECIAARIVPCNDTTLAASLTQWEIRRMAAKLKPPPTPFPADPDKLHQEGDWLWIPLKQEWRDVSAKPEERVRQRFIRRLVEAYGYSLVQMDQERRTQSGTKSPRADIVIWETPAKLAQKASPVLVIECKAESVGINLPDFYQGESYARATACEFFVATNERFTSPFKLIPGLPGEFVEIADFPRADDWGDAKRIQAIKDALRAFSRKEFQDLLFQCHKVLRDNHKMDPGRAFDTISKILFIKMFIERSGAHGTFTIDFIEARAKTRLPTDPTVHDDLFERTKQFYAADHLFATGDRLEVSESTFKRIVKLLERFDLSKTSDDIKGLAFERFLGATFRGDLGQFFTPRPVVNFMVDALDPHEGELVCDPAAGSGGFLIRVFEHVRDQIALDIQAQKDAARAKIEALALDPEEEERRIEAAFAELNQQLVPSTDDNQPIDTRLGRLAWRCIFGTDAEPRAARTAKMNMIMHGDGHGGIHHHDGLVDINGVFPGRFDVIITNPPFGSNVGRDQKVGGSEEAQVTDDADYRKRCLERYGEPWREHHDRLLAAQKAHTPILDLFEVGKGKNNRATEVVFVERCLQLLRPGGRMGIVLPDGNLNNPSLDWLRRWTEGKARLLGVVSLPEETFRSADASVKASVVFLQRFTDADDGQWSAAWDTAHAAVDPVFDVRRKTAEDDDALDAKGRRVALKAIESERQAALWAAVRADFDYPVFMAAPKAVGITGTGETGETIADDLPGTLAAFRSFVAWLDAGAKEGETPDFPLPSAA